MGRYFIALILSQLLFSGVFAEARPSVMSVAIIDKFYPPLEGFDDDQDRSISNWLYGLIDIDQDEEREAYYHGDLVHLIAAHPNFSFQHFPMRNNGQPLGEILVNLDKILVRFDDHPIDGLILSWESSTLISAFETPLKPGNVGIYRWQIRQWGLTSSSWQHTDEIIDKLETLNSLGVSVFTIAGNGGHRMVNTFSFAEGITTVGAKEPELSHFVANNAFVDTYAQAAYHIKRIDNENGQVLGYDIDGDGCIDIPIERLSGYRQPNQELPESTWQPIKGSSFAAPKAFKRIMLNQPATDVCTKQLGNKNF